MYIDGILLEWSSISDTKNTFNINSIGKIVIKINSFERTIPPSFILGGTLWNYGRGSSKHKKGCINLEFWNNL